MSTCSLLFPASSSGSSASSALLSTQQAALQRSRAAERARFGLPLWQLFGFGFVGVTAAIVYWSERSRPLFDLTHPSKRPISARSSVTDGETAAALLADVRAVLGRHGLSLGRVDLRVAVSELGGVNEGITFKTSVYSGLGSSKRWLGGPRYHPPPTPPLPPPATTPRYHPPHTTPRYHPTL